MGLFFQRYHPYSYCKNCKIKNVVAVKPFLNSDFYNKKKCTICKGQLELNFDQFTHDYYLLRGTKLKFPVKSDISRYLVIIPSIILWSIILLLFIAWIVAFIESGYNAATKLIYINFLKAIFGSEWPSLILILLTFYYLYQTVGFIWNSRNSIHEHIEEK